MRDVYPEDPAMDQKNYERILRIAQVLDRTGLSRSTLYRMIKAGHFPRQIQIAPRCCGWRESDITRWLEKPTDWPMPVVSSGPETSARALQRYSRLH